MIKLLKNVMFFHVAPKKERFFGLYVFVSFCKKSVLVFSGKLRSSLKGPCWNLHTDKW